VTPYIVLGAALACAGSFWYGTEVGADGEIANRVSQEQIVRDTREAAQLGAANAIAKINVKNVTITRKLETEVRENVIFRDCRSGDAGVRLYNSGISDGAVAPGGSVVPPANPATR